ncbi:hypothetical protein VP01_3196g1 [Puccinia sorghi]|uniref:Uncharacterized protein n=1 Tax=Puccinia sorghi TaxID=27349 RepID=A0A0L6V0D2_9BASI|nr:hypothetical protein VP01_3196g1 [Puccinia sorghi]
MQKLPGRFFCYSNLSQKVIQPSFDAQSLCIRHSDCAKTSRYANRWSLDDSLAGAFCISTADSQAIILFRGSVVVSEPDPARCGAPFVLECQKHISEVDMCNMNNNNYVDRDLLTGNGMQDVSRLDWGNIVSQAGMENRLSLVIRLLCYWEKWWKGIIIIFWNQGGVRDITHDTGVNSGAPAWNKYLYCSNMASFCVEKLLKQKLTKKNSGSSPVEIQRFSSLLSDLIVHKSTLSSLSINKILLTRLNSAIPFIINSLQLRLNHLDSAQLVSISALSPIGEKINHQHQMNPFGQSFPSLCIVPCLLLNLLEILSFTSIHSPFLIFHPLQQKSIKEGSHQIQHLHTKLEEPFLTDKLVVLVVVLCSNNFALEVLKLKQSELVEKTTQNKKQPNVTCHLVFIDCSWCFMVRVHHCKKKLTQLPEVDMQIVPGRFCCYSKLSPRVIQRSFDANSLCRLQIYCSKPSTYASRWSFDGSLAGACCMSTAGIKIKRGSEEGKRRRLRVPTIGSGFEILVVVEKHQEELLKIKYKYYIRFARVFFRVLHV